jgi:hypothetical protein
VSYFLALGVRLVAVNRFCLVRGTHTLVSQQRIELRLTTTEGFERLHRRAAAADF